MSALDFLMRMWPMYMLGFFMIWATIKSGNKDLLLIKPHSVISWVKFIGIISLLRFIGFYFTWKHQADVFSAVSWIPWPTTLMVWWEDSAHVLPLLLLYRLIGTSKKTWPVHALAFLTVWIAFGSGHVYQGFFSAACISFYIPFTLKLSKKYGLGTIMACHVIYDLSTILLIQGMMRFM